MDTGICDRNLHIRPIGGSFNRNSLFWGSILDRISDQLDHRALQTPVSKMLTRNPIFVCEDDGPAVALSKMLENDVECVLVHTAQHQFAGILTSTDVLETVLLFHRVCGAPDLVRFRLVDLDMSSGMPLDMVFSRGARSVRDVMTKAPATVREGDALSAAMDRMQADEARNLVVVNDSGRVVGLLEDRDVLRTLPLPVPLFSVRESPTRFHERLFATEKGAAPTGSVGASMKKDPAHERPDALFTDAIRTMMERDVSALPVLEDGALVGILSVTDVLRVVRVALQIGSLLGGSDAATTKAA